MRVTADNGRSAEVPGFQKTENKKEGLSIMSSLLSTILVALLVLTSCSIGGPAGQTMPPAQPNATPTPTPTPAPAVLPPEPTVAPVDSIWIPAAGGGITVRVVPRGERAIQFHRLDRTRWGFYGNQENLVGKAYQIELENTTSSRAKIVVGVDGMNIYRKKDLAGNPTDDIGSILSPGAKRTLPGWQTSSERAERFVFSPSDWSDARGIHDAQIGTILVEIYFEEESPAADTMKRKSATTLGTASGEEVDSQVGTVSFVPSSSQPSATALVIYGGTRTSEW